MNNNMQYGAAHGRASRPVEDDAGSERSARHESLYEPYRPRTDRNESSGYRNITRTPSWNLSPVDLQQSLPPGSPLNAPSQSPNMRPSIFGSRSVLDGPYQEQIAWANSTQFKPAVQEGPNLHPVQTTHVITVDNSKVESRRYFRHPRHVFEPWTSGILERFPWWGFVALFVILLLTGASAGILLAGHGTTMEDWRFGHNAQPHVYISVFEMVMNFLILFALVDGMVTKYWRNLLHGTTLSAMHDTYRSTSLWPALKMIATMRFNAVAIACVISVFSFIRGPFFQRALTLSESRTIDYQGNVSLQIAPFPNIQYFQSNDADPRKQGGVTEAFANVLKNLGAGSPLPYDQPLAMCGDSCTGIVKGPSFKTECTLTTQSFDLSSLPTECKSCTSVQCEDSCQARQQTEFNPTFFSINYKQTDDALTLTSTHKSTSSCKGDLSVQTCKLTHTTSDYPIVVTKGTIDRKPAESDARTYDEKLPFDDHLMKKYWPLAFETLFPPLSVNVTPTQNYASLQYNKCVEQGGTGGTEDVATSLSPSCSNSSSLDPRILANDPSVMYATQSTASSGEDTLCSLTWKDPMQDMLKKMQSLLFRVTVDMAASDGSVFAPTFTGDALADLRKDWSQSIPITGHRTSPVYHTNATFVAIGILLSVMSIAAVVPLYYGFWELGRKVSLDPLEIARAFGAPQLDGLDDNATPEMMTLERGGMSVRYGALERHGEVKKLRIEEMSRATIRMPWQGEIFG